MEYRIDLEKAHYSSESSPGIKFVQNGKCASTIPYKPADYEQIVAALPQFNRNIHLWQKTRHFDRKQGM